MQYTRYLPGNYYPRDDNVGNNGNQWSIPHNNINWNSRRGFNIPLPQFTMNQYQDLVHQKEILRQMILKHDAIFRYQVNELHRVYGRQRELMNEIKRRKLAEDHLHLQVLGPNSSMPQQRSEISQKTYWPIVNLTSMEPPAPSRETFQEYLNSSGKSVQLGGDYLSAQNVPKERNISSSESNISRKRMLDLELPAEEYIDNEEAEAFEEENPVRRPNIMISEFQPQCYSRVSFVNPGDSSISLTSCTRTSLLFDLNEPVQPVESVCLDSELETENINEEIRDGKQDLSGTTHTECSKLNIEEIAGSDETRTDKSLLVSSLRKYKEIPIAVQALPCFTTEASFCSNPKSSVRNSTFGAEKFNPHQGSASTPTSESLSSCTMQHGFSGSTSEHIAAVNGTKVSDYTGCPKGMDLNLTPPTNLSEHQSASTSNVSHLNFLQGRNVASHKISEVLDSTMVPDSTPESRKCARDYHLVGPRVDRKLSATSTCIDLNSCIKEEPLSSSPGEATELTAERDLEGPVSPENKECSPPRLDSSDIITNTSIHLSKRDHSDPIEELDRVAADILIFISSSVFWRYSKTIIGEPSEASSNSLGWLAEVATSLASNPENEFEQPIKVIALRNQPRRGQARRRKDLKNLQTDVSAFNSLLHQVGETNIAPKPGPMRKTPNRTSSKGMARCNDRDRTMSSLLQQHTFDNKHGIADRSLKGWGLTKRRQKARKPQPSVSPLFLADE